MAFPSQQRIECPRRVVATVSTRFAHSEILRNHDFQGFSLNLVQIDGFHGFCCFPSSKTILIYGSTKKYFCQNIFYYFFHRLTHLLKYLQTLGLVGQLKLSQSFYFLGTLHNHCINYSQNQYIFYSTGSKSKLKEFTQ